MRVTLSSPAMRRIIFAAAFALAWLLIFQASEIWLADYRLNSGLPQEMQKGAALLPGDADAWDRLGRYYSLSFSDPNLPLAITDLQRAVKLDPLSEDYWLDLAAAYDATGDDAKEQQAFAQALKAYPTSAVVQWNYGNFLLREGHNAQAYDEIEKAVRGDPQLLPLAMSRAWRATGDVNQLLERVIPANISSYMQALNFFASMHNLQAGLVVWQKLIALKQPVYLPQTFLFLDELMREGDNTDAIRVWNEAVSAAGQPRLAVTTDSLVSDGTFQAPFPNGGLGWRWDGELGASIDFDSMTPDGKGRSVRLDFNGGVNINVSQPSQYVAVEPGRVYHFHASMRTDQITTDSGMRFVVSDPFHAGTAFGTANLTGSHAWMNVDLDVSTGPQAHFLLIQLVRTPSTFFDNKLGGTVWIAGISLVPAGSESPLRQ